MDSRFAIAAGPRAAEALLLHWVDEALSPLSPVSRRSRPQGASNEGEGAESSAPFSSLLEPVRIVVPSGTLRRHVGRRLTQHRGGAVVGVTVQTLFGLALEVLERAGEVPAGGGAILGVLVERFGRERPALRRALDDLQDGYGALAGTVRDLLDAGLDGDAGGEGLVDAAVEALEPPQPNAPPGAQRRRAMELVRVAGDCAQALRIMGLGRTSTLLRRARELLDEDFLGASAGGLSVPSLLPSSRVLVHGFADATGVAADLLEALLRHPGARLLVDQPPDPAQRNDRERAFTERLLLRLGGSGALVSEAYAAPPPPRLSIANAPGAEEESRRVALQLRQLLDEPSADGTAPPLPEDVLVVARQLDPYRLPLARHLERLGVPFTMPGAVGAATAVSRAADALRALLARGPDAATESWLEVLEGLPKVSRLGARRAELRLACHGLGAGRLRQVARLDPAAVLTPGRDALALSLAAPPVVDGVIDGAMDEADELERCEDPSTATATPASTPSRRRWLAGAVLRSLVTAAQSLVRRLEEWPSSASLAEHWERVDDLLTQDLGARREGPLADLRHSLQQAARELPGELPLSRSEAVRLLRDLLRGTGRHTLGGVGGGVRVLNAMEARGLTADHLFLMGINRDLFPRVVREDPLLPDGMRRSLASVLPDVPVKRRGFDEERYLFAQLMECADHVAVSWQSESDDGDARAPSPLLERLRWSANGLPETAPPVSVASGVTFVPADELARQAALLGGRPAFLSALPAALAQGGRFRGSAIEPESPPDLSAGGRWGAVLGRILDEMDPDLSTAEGRGRRHSAGPYLGFIGSPGPSDPRRRDLWITRLEHMAGCPWQVLVSRFLRVEPAPDPLAQLPEITPLLVGQVVHRVLEGLAIAEEVPSRRELTADLIAAGGVEVAWPDEAALDERLESAAAEVLREEGLALPALARPLAARARPYLEVARQLDSEGGAGTVLGVEMEGQLSLDGPVGARPVRFRADRVGTGDDGTLYFIDYKTGKLRDGYVDSVAEEAKRDTTRRQRFLRQIATGERLQAVAYSLGAAEVSEHPAIGAYQLLRPGLDAALSAAGARTFEAASGDQEARGAFHHAATVALEAWERGVFPPRLEDPRGKEPRRCTYCAVAQGCLRRDSGARRRLAGYAQNLREGKAAGHRLTPLEAANVALWQLPTGEVPPETGAVDAGAARDGDD